ncbi:porin [Thiomicrorhabdus sp. Milos-T2]|uniref:porin n=1 Tax=Thiomicrorhabdus sp. Milos-T2 TaxID=90814 RepID=UPI0004946FDE|nr:porin [Thiomicrorhabdus sp. Milos-T2]
MNKQFKLGSISLGIMLASGMVMADTTVYGVGHISYDSVDDGTNSTTGLASNSSRLGFKGSNEVADGIKAIYQFETGVDVSGRSGADGNGGGKRDGQLFTNARDSFVGLSGAFGTIMGGRLGVENQWLYDANLFGDQVGDLGNFWGMQSGIPGRADGVIAYASPDFGSVDFILAYKGEEGTKNSAASVAKVNFKVADLKVGLGYAGIGKGNYTTPAGLKDSTATAITASYAFDKVNLVAGYQSVSNLNGTTADQTSWTAGTSFAANDKMTVKAQYMALNNDGVNTDATGYAIGLDYGISKNTTAYVAYASTSNDAAAQVQANSWGHGDSFGSTIAAGKDPSALSVGVVYKFDAKVF